MFTTRMDRLLTIISFVVSVLVVLTILGLFWSFVGPLELLVALAIALPLTVILSRALRSRFTRPDRPA